MSLSAEIRDSVWTLVGQYMNDKKFYSQICSVDSIDEDKRLIDATPINGDSTRESRIQASIELTEGLYIKPVIGSFVVITYISKELAHVTAYSEIDEFSVKVGDSWLKIVNGEIVFNEGSLGGLPITGNITSRLNLIEDKVNSILSTLKTTVIPLAPTGTYPLSTDFGTIGSLTKSNDSNIENDKIKQ